MNMVEIQFIEGIKESSLPRIKLTKSKNGETGTATFIFINPKLLLNTNLETITGMSLLFNNKKIITTDINIIFHNGRPFLIKAILVFKNSKEWFDFLYFMSYYSKETGLSFSEKNSSF
jgi:photosystem II protein